MEIKKLTATEAKAFLTFLRQLDYETNFMLFNPDERRTTNLEMQQQIVETYQQNGVILVAQDKNNILGFISATRSNMQKIKHIAYIVIGIRKKFRHQGIGQKLFEELFKWAFQNQVTKLELTVMVNNLVALHLYQQNGFEIEGCKRNSIFQEGHYIDEYYMGKIISN